MRHIAFLLLVFVFTSCTKEVGRKFYILELKFDSGGSHQSKGKIFEKDKDYKHKDSSDPESVTIGSNQLIYFYAKDGIDMRLFKTIEHKFIGITTQNIDVIDASCLDGTSGTLFGTLELEGEYSSPFRRIKVQSGTFTFDWSNAEDFGKTDQVLTGTWTLKRK